MGEVEKRLKGISKMLMVLAIAAVIIVAAGAGTYWWFYVRTPGKQRSTITCNAPSEVPRDQDITITGEISPAVADATVTLTFTKPGGTQDNETVTSESDGSFTCKYLVDVEGNWTVLASWLGNSEYRAATSTLVTFEVTEPLEPGESLITCVILLPRGVDAGENVTVTGNILPVVADATVTLNFTDPDNSTFTETATSESDGSFTHMHETTGTDVKGLWKVTASWPGTVDLDPATSDPATFTIFIGEVKVGVIGPMMWTQGKGMERGAILAAEQINDAGGILGHKIVVETEDDGGEDPVVAKAAIERLAPRVDFLMGGFRTECMWPIREGAMDAEKIFLICGSATTELLNCWLTPEMGCGQCVWCNYDRYKYLFRVTPPNASGLFSHMLVPYVKHYLIPKVMIPIFGKPIKVAVIVENAAWTAQLRGLIEKGGKLFFGQWNPYNPTNYTAEVVYKNYPLPTDTDFSVQLQAIEDSGAHVIVQVFSAKAGQIFITQWGTRQTPALPIGVDVLGQENEHWDITEGKCEYEVVASTPPRIAVTEKVLPFWDAYEARWDSDPIYTAFGTYDAMHILKTAIERAGTFDPDAYPETDYITDPKGDLQERTRGRLIKELENIDMPIVMGQFKFTQYHGVFVENTKDPPGLEAYYHKPNEPPEYYTEEELYAMPAEEIWYTTWLTSERVVPLLVQWQNGERVITFPLDQPYTEEIIFPPWMLP